MHKYISGEISKRWEWLCPQWCNVLSRWINFLEGKEGCFTDLRIVWLKREGGVKN